MLNIQVARSSDRVRWERLGDALPAFAPGFSDRSVREKNKQVQILASNMWINMDESLVRRFRETVEGSGECRGRGS